MDIPPRFINLLVSRSLRINRHSGIFFLKDYLNLTAAFIASIGFWAGIPWTLKMPVGFLVDKFWKRKNYLVFLGAIIVFLSILIMFLLISNRQMMEGYSLQKKWYIISAILTLLVMLFKT